MHASCLIFFIVLIFTRLYSVIISDPRIALLVKLIHKGNEVIGREIGDRHDLEFGIRTMARDDGRRHGEETGNAMEEDVEIEENRKNEERKGRDNRRGRRRGESVRGCSGARKCPRPRGEKRVRVSLNNFDHTSRQSDTRAYEYIHLNAPRRPRKYCPNF